MCKGSASSSGLLEMKPHWTSGLLTPRSLLHAWAAQRAFDPSDSNQSLCRMLRYAVDSGNDLRNNLQISTKRWTMLLKRMPPATNFSLSVQNFKCPIMLVSCVGHLRATRTAKELAKLRDRHFEFPRSALCHGCLHPSSHGLPPPIMNVV